MLNNEEVELLQYIIKILEKEEQFPSDEWNEICKCLDEILIT